MKENINIPDKLFENAFINLEKNRPDLQKDEEPKAVKIWFDDKRFYVELGDGRVIGTPLKWYPGLLNATKEQQNKWEINTGDDIHREEIDEDILVKKLL